MSCGYAQKILGGTLVTYKPVRTVKWFIKFLVAQDMYYDGPTERKEFYFQCCLTVQKGQNVIMYSTEGGMNIEEVAHNTPEKFFKEWVHPAGGLQPFQARKIAFNLGLSGESFKNCVKFVTNLYNAYVGLIVQCLRSIHCSKLLMIKL
jgi:succinyl-CoA synthetase beta subunit